MLDKVIGSIPRRYFLQALKMALLVLLAMCLGCAVHKPIPPSTNLHSVSGYRDCDECPEIIDIPAGEVWMSVDTVAIRRFAVGKQEITKKEFEIYANANNVKLHSCFHGTNDDDPANCITWYDAQAYVKWLKEKTNGGLYRLPSEAEWEYFAGRMDAKGNSPLGLLNLFTGVGEWMADCWSKNFMRATSRGAPCSDRDSCRFYAVRGGQELDSPPQDREQLLARIRHRFGHSGRYSRIGFRVAKDLPYDKKNGRSTESDETQRCLLDGTYNGLFLDGKRLFDEYTEASNPADAYAKLSKDKRTTFESIMHAMKSEGFLDLVEGITAIWGDRTLEHTSGAGYHYFRLSVKLSDDAPERLKKHGEYDPLKGSSCHVKLPVTGRVSRNAYCVKATGGVPTLHISWLVDNPSTGEIDIDYRGSDALSHLQLHNSDVRAVNGQESHYRRHVSKYGKGLARWWIEEPDCVDGRSS